MSLFGFNNLALSGPLSLFNPWGGMPRMPERIDQPPAPATVQPADPRDKEEGYWQSVGAAMTRYVDDYAKSPPGGYLVWRLMDQHPTLTLARLLVIGPILTGTRTVEVRMKPGETKRRAPVTGDGVVSDPRDRRAEFVSGVMEPLLFGLIRDCCDALSMGHATFRQIWGVKGGMDVISAFRHYQPEEVTLLTDDQRDYVGIRHGQQEYFGLNAFNYANEPKYRYWYGRPRHENCRAEWWEKLQAKVKGRQLDHKAAGVTMVVKGPPGTGRKDKNGNAIDGSQAAQLAANEIEQLKTVWVPKFILPPPDPARISDTEYLKAYAELAKITAFDFEQFDWQNVAPSALALLDKFKYIDVELMRAWHRPEREAMEGQHGTKAEAGFHGQIGITDSDLVHSDICGGISKGPINDLMARNFGEESRDENYLKAGPLIDAQIQRLLTLLQPLFQNKDVAADFWDKLDKSAVFTSFGVEPRQDIDVNEDLPTPPPPVIAPPPQPAGVNGNGDKLPADQNDQKLAKLMASRLFGEE